MTSYRHEEKGMDKDKRHKAKEGSAATDERTGLGRCPVIVAGIGASESGLSSLQQLFARMPGGHGVAFVLILPLPPERENRIIEWLRGQTAFSVVEATDGMEVLAERIHVMPSDEYLNISGARLTFQEPILCNGLRMPIDHFFCSLASDQGRRGCGVLLSGTGSDGTLGLSEIRAAAGRTFMETPRRSERSETAQKAIDAGVVDAFLSPDGLAGAIVARAEQVTGETRNEPAESPAFDADFRAVLDVLRTRVGHDFRCYKPGTLVRRIRRRMALRKVATYAEYNRFLEAHPEEISLLHKDLLIGVTEFFRQPQAWDVLKEKAIGALVDKAEPGSEIRVWVPGCATGKEVYSLAMLLTEEMETSGKDLSMQIFATDSDGEALATARSGSYTAEDLGPNVSPQRRKRFFTGLDGRYQVVKEIRQNIVFAPQNLTADPPFSRIDLIICRNLLIYLEQAVQKKVIALFHFALREGGFLFLGNAETIGDREDLFEPVSKKWRIYRRIGVGRRVAVEIPVRPSAEPLPAVGTFPVGAPALRMSLASAAQQVLVERFAPACVIIDRKLQVLYVHGEVEGYLTFPAGELTTKVVDMAREGLGPGCAAPSQNVSRKTNRSPSRPAFAGGRSPSRSRPW
jgi:two-component system, chemotaxis family, CheB/CheR fusion protein